MAGLMSAEQLQAVRLMGEKDVLRKGIRIVEPAYGRRAIRALLRIGFVQDDSVMQQIFQDAGVNKQAANIFKRNKLVMRHTETDGSLEVVPNIPGLADDNLSEYAATEEMFGSLDSTVVDDRYLKYKLNHVFTDVTLTDKLRLSPRRVQALKRLAVSDPAQAAASLTDYLKQSGYPNVVVTAGDYARSVGRMRDVVREYADTIVYKDSAAPAVITPKEMFITFDGFSESKPLWTVRGPIKYATEVQAVYQMAIHYGPERVLFMLGIETVMLQINIFDEQTGDYYSGTVEGYSSLQGIQPRDSALPSELTVEQQTRLRDAAQKVSPVLVDGLVTGSAVHVSDRHWIVNEHTLSHAADADLVPELLKESIPQWRSVGNDVAMVKRQYGTPVQWVLRNADVGERVVLCFSVGDSVEYSEVLRVQSVTMENIMLSDSAILRKGASGAAVVSLRDSALLGIFSTIRNSSVVCSVFDSSSFTNVTDFESVMSSEYSVAPGVAAGNVTYDRMVRRGLQGFLEGIDQATTALYVRHSAGIQQVGLVASTTDNWQTTVNPDTSQLVLEDATPITFRAETHSRFTVVSPPPVLKPLPNVRTVIPGERVFLFTKVGREVAMTSVKVVTHCLSDMHAFVVEDFGDSEVLLDGGLLVAERDAAVVGQYLARDVDSYGESVVRCVPFGLYRSGDQIHRVNSTVLMSELSALVIKSPEVLPDVASIGNAALRLAGEKLAYRHGTSVFEGGANAIALWDAEFEYLIQYIGFQLTDWHLFVGHSRKMVSDAYLALLFMSDPGGFDGFLKPHIDVGFTSGKTPIMAEFPRPSSTGTVVGREARAESDGSKHRLRDLESRLELLMGKLDKAGFS